MAERKYLICPQCGKKLCKVSNPDMEIICQQCRSIIDVKSTNNGIELYIKYAEMKNQKLKYNSAN